MAAAAQKIAIATTNAKTAMGKKEASTSAATAAAAKYANVSHVEIIAFLLLIE